MCTKAGLDYANYVSSSHFLKAFKDYFSMLPSHTRHLVSNVVQVSKRGAARVNSKWQSSMDSGSRQPSIA